MASNGKSEAQAVYNVGEEFKPWEFDLNELGDYDVEIRITHSGVCHSDMHTVNGDWGPQTGMWPIVPGHEILGVVTQVGSKVTRVQVGQRAGVGPQAFSCLGCKQCNDGRENYCVGKEGFVGSYAAKLPNGFVTKGGYARYNRTHERFVVGIPDGVKSEWAPLLCAGITTYAPLTYAKVGPNSKVAVVGIGGLGHLALQFAAAMGAEVTAISTSPNKEEEAKKFGAAKFLVSKDAEAMKAHTAYFDAVLNTTSASLPWAQYLNLIAPGGYFCQIGAPPKPLELEPFQLIFRNVHVMGSLIGSPSEIEEMLNFCVKHNVKPQVETLPWTEVNEAFKRMRENTVRYRCVLLLPDE